MKYLVFILSVLFLFQSCQEQVDPFAHIGDDALKAVLQKSIDYHGGLDAWQDLNKMRFNKDFKLLDRHGIVEKSFEQIHDYNYADDHYEIISKERMIYTDTIISKLKDGVFSRTKNGIAAEDSPEKIEKTINSGTYVVGIPFKLLDPNVKLSLEEEEFEGEAVYTIQAAYNSDQNDNHSTNDVWKYYIAKNTGKVIANWVDAGDHQNIINNITFKRINGILLNEHRESYRLDSLGNKAYKRAIYFYKNYELK